MTFLTSLEMIPLGMWVFWCCLDCLTSCWTGMSTRQTQGLHYDVSGQVICSWSHVPYFLLAQDNYFLYHNTVWTGKVANTLSLYLTDPSNHMKDGVLNLESKKTPLPWQGISPARCNRKTYSGQMSEETQEWNWCLSLSVGTSLFWEERLDQHLRWLRRRNPVRVWLFATQLFLPQVNSRHVQKLSAAGHIAKKKEGRCLWSHQLSDSVRLLSKYVGFRHVNST